MIDLATAVKNGIITRELTDDERWAVEDILNAAEEWANGTMSLGMFAQVGPLPAWNSQGRRYDSTGYGRCLALMSTPQGDPRWSHLNDAIKELVRQQDVTVTTQGVFDRSELFAAGVTVRGEKP